MRPTMNAVPAATPEPATTLSRRAMLAGTAVGAVMVTAPQAAAGSAESEASTAAGLRYYALGTGVLRQGQRSGHVADLQRALKVLRGSQLKATGYFDDATIRAVWYFQRAQRMRILGYVDNYTRSRLYSLLGTSAAPSAPGSLVIVVNKHRRLPTTYAPPLALPQITYHNGHRTHPEAARELARLVAAARTAGAGTIGITSGYRSYATQKSIYDSAVARMGKATAEKWYARPGYSEHQTGLAVDLRPYGAANCSRHQCIDETPQGAWLVRNAWRYGFILRYPAGLTWATGYGHEPWHWRYVGLATAKAYRDGAYKTWEHFTAVEAAPTYW